MNKKDRGSLLMVSEFDSELHGRLRCTHAQRDAYVAANPQSKMAQLFAALRSRGKNKKRVSKRPQLARGFNLETLYVHAPTLHAASSCMHDRDARYARKVRTRQRHDVHAAYMQYSNYGVMPSMGHGHTSCVHSCTLRARKFLVHNCNLNHL